MSGDFVEACQIAWVLDNLAGLVVRKNSVGRESIPCNMLLGLTVSS
jgi:hypothetical protein